MKIQNKKILVTGGASGIGLALAERCVKDNNIVIICGRRQNALEEATIKIPSLITYQCDVADENDRLSLFAVISKDHPDLNILVNNAGIQNWMNVSDPDFASRAHQEIIINSEAPVHLSSLFIQLPSLEIIMNVTSGLSFSPLAKVPVYCATKAFLHSYTLSLRHLLKEKNIDVIEIIPPALNTDLGGKGIHDFAPPVSGFIDSVFQQLEEDKKEITYESSGYMLNAGAEQLREAFKRMNKD
jgi:uncharacterized oxidoreductase